MYTLENKLASLPRDISHFGVTVGLEAEGVRITPDARIARTPHPAVFGDKLSHPYITVDYSEQQVEAITPPLDSDDGAHAFMTMLRAIVEEEAHKAGELLWPLSAPPRLPENEDDIEIGVFDDSPRGRASRAYREELAQKYGKRQQLISGVHYNFSFDERLLDALGSRDDLYMKVARNYQRYGWLIVYALGASPDLSGEHPYSVSLRNGHNGYRNHAEIFPDCSSMERYVASIKHFLERGLLSAPKELYSPVRIKSLDPSDALGSLERDGVHYLELRSVDVNPFDQAGVSRLDLHFLHAFTLFLLFADEPAAYACWLRDADRNVLEAADNGLHPNAMIRTEHEMLPLRAEAVRVVAEIAALIERLGLNDTLGAGVESVLERVKNPEELLYASRLRALACASSLYDVGLKLARDQQDQALREPWKTPGFEEWEMSTQLVIKEAVRCGIRVEPLDARDNILRLTAPDGRVEYVKQATKTSADSYITPLLMNNKVVAKRILAEAGIRVPQGVEFDAENREAALRAFEGTPVVIKPKSTNFGSGVTMFENGASLEALMEAATFALTYDEVVIAEEFFPGKEYRFLVIDGELAGVLHRAPAQVVGDGVSTIEQLVARKNEHPYRSVGYRSPLMTIQLGHTEVEYLRRQGLDALSVLEKDRVALLRPNSNISTGGDSIDVTDEAADVFKRYAVQAADAFNAAFCGVDMIVENLSDPNSVWGVIEVNFNPAIHIHSFPLVGQRRNIAALVLQTIFK